MAQIGSLSVDLVAELSSWRRDLGRAQRDLQSSTAQMNKRLTAVDRQFRRLNRTVGQARAMVGAFISALAVRQLGQFGTAALNVADEIHNTSQRLGLSAEALQEFRYAARESNIEVGQLNAALTALVRRSGEAQRGNATFAKSFADIGISVEELRGLDSEGLFYRVAEALNGVESQSLRVAAADRVMSEAGRQVVNVFAEGEEGIRRYAAEARALGQVMDRDVVRRGAEAATRMTQMRQALVNAFHAGVIESFTDRVDDLNKGLEDMTRLANDMGESLGGAMAYVVENADVVIDRIETVGRLLAAYGGARAGSVFGPVGTAAGAATGLFSPEIAGWWIETERDLQDSNRRLAALRDAREQVLREIEEIGSTPRREERLRSLSAQVANEEAFAWTASARPQAEGSGRPATQLPEWEPFEGGSAGSAEGGSSSREAMRERIDSILAWSQAVDEGLTRYGREVEEASRLADAMRAGRSERRRVEQSIEAENAARELGVKIGSAEHQAIERLIQARDRETRRLEQAEKALDALSEARRRSEEAQAEAMRYLGRVAESSFDRVGASITDAFVRGEDALLSFQSVALGVVSEVAQAFTRLAVINPLLNSLGLNGGSALPVLGDLIGGGSPTGVDFTKGLGGGVFDATMPLFAKGGITRRPAIFGEAGPEAAVPLPDGRRIPVDLRGLPAGGGGAPVTVNVINNGGDPVQTRERSDGRGGREIDVIIGEIVAQQVATYGSAANRSIRNNLGGRPQLTKR